MIRVLRLFIHQISTQAITRLLRFLYVFLIALLLPPQDMAVYTIGLAQIGTYLGYAEFGQRVLLASRINKIDRYANVLLSNSFTITILVHFVCILGFLITSALFANNSKELTSFIALSLAVIARGLALWVRKVFIAIHASQELPRLAMLGRSLELVVGIGLLLVGRGLTELCILFSLTWSIEAVWSIRLLIVRYAARIRVGLQIKIARAILVHSPIYALVGGTQILAVNSNTFNMGLQKFAPIDIASFAISTQFLSLLLTVPMTFGISIIGLLHGRSETRLHTEHVDLILRIALLLSVLFVLIGAPILQLLLGLIYASNYPSLPTYFGILAWSIPSFSGLILIQQILISHKRSLLALYATMLSIVCYLVLSFIPQYPRPEMMGWAYVAGTYMGLAAGLLALHVNRATNSIYTLVGGLGIVIGILALWHVFRPLANSLVVNLGLAVALIFICNATRFLRFAQIIRATVSRLSQFFTKKM